MKSLDYLAHGLPLLNNIPGDTWELVEEYYGSISAPDKGFFLIPDSAHSPLWENPADTCDALKQIKEDTFNG